MTRQETVDNLVLAVIRAAGSEGVRSLDLRKRLPRDLRTSELRNALRHLRGDGRVRAEGVSKNMRNFATDDQDTNNQKGTRR